MASIVNRTIGPVRRWLTRHTPDAELWRKGAACEIAFWEKWLQTRGGKWPQDYAFRMDPEAPLQEHVARWLPEGARQVRILDVGAGPATSLGKTLPGIEIELQACDALGGSYERLPWPPSLPPVKTTQCDSEALQTMFSTDHYDVVHARNTLDHSYDPMAAIRSMLAVAKPGGVVILDHAANEAVNEGYKGFHQWNFFIAGRNLWLSNRHGRHNVIAGLGSAVEVAQLERDGSPHAYAVLRKRRIGC